MVRTTPSPRFTLAPLAALAILASSSPAAANGRFPATTNVRFQPGNSELILLPTTFGLLLSKDNGTSFQWICEDTIGYGGTYDPDYAIAGDGTIYATTFEGLQVSTDGSCTYNPTQFFGDLTGGTALDPITGHWVGEVEVASDGKVWACTSTGGTANDVYVSTDGTTFNSAGNWNATAWWKSLRVSQSDPNVVYVAGFQIPEGANPAKALLFKTIDGGANWTDIGVADFAFGTQPNLFVEGISPTNADIVFARVLGARDPQGDDLYRSIDGGANWTKVLEMNGTISAFAIRSDESVYVGTGTACTEDIDLTADASIPNKGCLRISPDGAADSWTAPAVEPKLGCIAERPSDQTLFACAANWDPDNFAFGLSMDQSASWEKIMRFVEISGPLDCPAGTKQDTCEEQMWPNLCIMLGICAGDADAGVGAADASVTIVDPPEEGGCFGCQSSGWGGLGSMLAVFGLFGLLFRRRSGTQNPN
jgi:uncharacterized protein (TIGR03382 family)